jgi:spore coat polysaccharide biosynthesis predicted glycosyltransferase SpsG
MTPNAGGLRCVFRVAAGPRIGFGHLMRARALARALGVRPVMSLRGGRAAVRAARRLGVDVIETNRRSELPADVMIVDDPSPARAARWLARGRRQGIPTIAVRDRRIGCGPADLIVDGSIGLRPRANERARLEGPAFAILDPDFARSSPARAAGLRVFIALGGGEHVAQIADRLVRAIKRQAARANIRVAAGLCAARWPALRGATWVRRNGLRRELERCDVAVVAGGVTLYEACALGRATVALPIVSGQRATVRAAASLGAVVAPAVRQSAAALAHIGRAVAALLNDPRRRRALGSAARRLVDGRGAFRVAGRIRKLVKGLEAGGWRLRHA